MKLLRLLALSIAATAWCASAALACDVSKASATKAASCETKSSATKTASASSCCSKSATTAVTASAQGACPASAACPMSAEQCKAMMAAGATTADIHVACATKGTKTAGSGQCSRHAAAHADCAVCSDEMACDDEVKATGARAQVVALRNGTMIVYTLDGTGNVRALQAAVAHRNAQVVAALQGDAKLCSSCKKLRGALASGKLVREVVNVERGSQVLITSSDKAIVEQIQSSTNAQLAARTKS